MRWKDYVNSTVYFLSPTITYKSDVVTCRQKWCNVDVIIYYSNGKMLHTCPHCNLKRISTWAASFLEQSRSSENLSWMHSLILPPRVRKARHTSHSWSFLFHSEAYGMQACNSGMHDSMGEELESCFKDWAQRYCTARGHTVAGKQGLFSRCWDSHFCFPRRVFHSWSVRCVLILFEEGGCQQPRHGKRDFDYIVYASFVTRLKNNTHLPL